MKRPLLHNCAIQICGTGSGVGKSVIVAGLCRLFLQDGYSVSPFKAQNMALNSFVTKKHGEIGRAQATQAQACRIEPSVDMNPVLIKPSSDVGAQIIVLGKPIGNMKAMEYTKYKKNLRSVVRKSFDRLIDKYEIVVIEGAGSPAEINLKAHDIVNMKMAEYAKAPVILVGDIDKGGVFAWIIGTLELLTKKEKERVKGIIINKFRGDKALLKPGIDFLEERTGIKVLGIVPYFKEIKLPEEDSVFLEERARGKWHRGQDKGMLNIDVLRLPHISNFTDFDALEKEPDVALHYVTSPEELNNPDLIIIPGTKNTISDLMFLKKSGLAEKVVSIISSNTNVFLLGICGGYQILGEEIYDRYSLESDCKRIRGLCLLPVKTHLKKEKTLTQIMGKEASSGIEITGYEIHHGNSESSATGGLAYGEGGGNTPFFEIVERNGKKVSSFDGIRVKGGSVSGTYIHGLFDSDAFRRNFLNKVREKKGLPHLSDGAFFEPDREFDKLAKLLRENIDTELLYRILRNRC